MIPVDSREDRERSASGAEAASAVDNTLPASAKLVSFGLRFGSSCGGSCCLCLDRKSAGPDDLLAQQVRFLFSLTFCFAFKMNLSKSQSSSSPQLRLSKENAIDGETRNE